MDEVKLPTVGIAFLFISLLPLEKRTCINQVGFMWCPLHLCFEMHACEPESVWIFKSKVYVNLGNLTCLSYSSSHIFFSLFTCSHRLLAGSNHFYNLGDAGDQDPQEELS